MHRVPSFHTEDSHYINRHSAQTLKTSTEKEDRFSTTRQIVVSPSLSLLDEEISISAENSTACKQLSSMLYCLHEDDAIPGSSTKEWYFFKGMFTVQTEYEDLFIYMLTSDTKYGMIVVAWT